MLAAIAVTAMLGAGILTGLNVEIVNRAVDRIQTFDISLPKPPPKEPPAKPRAEPTRAPKEQGAPAKRAEPTPVIAPKPKVKLPDLLPFNVSPVPGSGTSSSIGAGSAGTGRGAGGSGTGLGGGGSGAGYTPARITRKIPDSDYRRISDNRLPSGSATIHFVVNPQGRMTNCSVMRSSGDPQVDAILCQIAQARMRFSPARDPSGRPVSQEMAYTPTWRPR